MSKQNTNLCQQHVTVKLYQFNVRFSQIAISHILPHDQPSHKGLYKSIHILRYRANRQTDRQMERGKKR